MKPKLVLSCTVTFLCILQVAFAVSKPDFSGTWVLDKNRSFSNPLGLEQTLVVVHTGDQIKLESKQVTARGEQLINESYSLDGKEAEFAPPGGQPGAKGKRKASWLPEGRGVVIEDQITSDSPKGQVIQQVTRKWTLSPDGSTLTVDYYFDDQRGSFEAKRVFVKK
ncbi:MAG: hypothetical protein AABN33_25070 [Acidobacteriota bacterium]